MDMTVFIKILILKCHSMGLAASVSCFPCIHMMQGHVEQSEQSVQVFRSQSLPPN